MLTFVSGAYTANDAALPPLTLAVAHAGATRKTRLPATFVALLTELPASWMPCDVVWHVM